MLYTSEDKVVIAVCQLFVTRNELDWIRIRDKLPDELQMNGS